MAEGTQLRGHRDTEGGEAAEMAVRADLRQRKMPRGAHMENKDWGQAGREAAEQEQKILGKERG